MSLLNLLQNRFCCLCSVFLATGMWDLSTPPTLEGKVSISGPPGTSQEFGLKSTWARKEAGWHDVRGKGLHGDFRNQRLERKSGRRRKTLHEPEIKEEESKRESWKGEVYKRLRWKRDTNRRELEKGGFNYCWRQVL